MSSRLHDARQFARDVAQIGEAAGQRVTLRRYQTASGGASSWLGNQETRTWQPVPLQFHSLRLATTEDVEGGGGRILAGDLVGRCAIAPRSRDRLQTADGTEYEVYGEPQPETLLGTRYYTVIFRRAGVPISTF